MQAWLIRLSADSVRCSTDLTQLVIYSKRKPSIAQGDKILLLKGDPRYDGAIAGTTVVKNIEVSGEANAYSTTVQLEVTPLSDRRIEISDLFFSLEFVHNLESPWRHFSRPYRRVNTDDFRALEEGDIFLSRTAFLTFYLKLNESQKLDVQRLAIEHAGKFLESLTYSKRWLVLSKYIEEELLAVGPLLQEIEATWQQLRDDVESNLPDLDQVYFGDPDLIDASSTKAQPRHQPASRGMDSIGRQHRRFQRVAPLFGVESGTEKKGTPLFQAVQKGLAESDDDELFERHFREKQ